MASKTEIANFALSLIGTSKAISNVDTDQTAMARAVRVFYDTARDAVLRDFPWPFATKNATLNLVESDPTDEWGYSYQYPSDCLMIRKILSGVRNDTRNSRVAYRIVRGAAGRVIYTDEETAEAEYTVRETDVLQYPPDFTFALAYKLAVLIVPRLSGSDPFKLIPGLKKDYQDALQRAAANALNEQQDETPPDSDYVSVRE
jgi:hypothetical protein